MLNDTLPRFAAAYVGAIVVITALVTVIGII